MNVEKNALRTEYSRRRDGISEGLAKMHRELIRARLARVGEFSGADTVAGYSSVGSEVATGDVLRDILARGSSVCLPRTGQDGGLDFRRVGDLNTDLHAGGYGVPEPLERCERCPKQDVVLVPAVCVTQKCQRIGRGGGHYDRYLAGSDAFTIGLVYESQILKSIPADEWDIPLDMLVTEKRTYRR